MPKKLLGLFSQNLLERREHEPRRNCCILMVMQIMSYCGMVMVTGRDKSIPGSRGVFYPECV